MILQVITILEDLLGRQTSFDYEQTVGYCRGGDTWPNGGQEWDCLESTNGGSRPVMSKAECQRKCDLHSECSAYDRVLGEDPAQCCLFKGSSTGNGGGGRQCNVKGAKHAVSSEACTNWKIGAACGGAVIEDIAVSEEECVAECKSRSNCHCISWGVNTNALCRLETGPDATHRGQGAEDSGWKACEEPDFN